MTTVESELHPQLLSYQESHQRKVSFFSFFSGGGGICLMYIFTAVWAVWTVQAEWAVRAEWAVQVKWAVKVVYKFYKFYLRIFGLTLTLMIFWLIFSLILLSLKTTSWLHKTLHPHLPFHPLRHLRPLHPPFHLCPIHQLQGPTCQVHLV